MLQRTSICIFLDETSSGEIKVHPNRCNASACCKLYKNELTLARSLQAMARLALSRCQSRSQGDVQSVPGSHSECVHVFIPNTKRIALSGKHLAERIAFELSFILALFFCLGQILKYFGFLRMHSSLFL